jgi:hypothetical protein
MSDRTFELSTWLDAYRESFASVRKAQEQGFKAVERFARFQYAVAGDYLDTGVAYTEAALASKTPAELFAKQTELNTSLNEKLQARAEEFATIAREAQGSVTSFATETVSKASAAVRKAA